jgi:penicillin-insensitive murein endopeptidase
MDFVLRLGLRVVPLLALVSCFGPGLLTDGTSVSVGTFNRGVLRHSARLPDSGDGFTTPSLWLLRGARHTTDEFATALVRSARRVAREHPGALLGIADLSLRGGGDSELHRSHENGRDADLIWYAVDPRGRPVAPVNAMPRYDSQLQARPPRETPGVSFSSFSPRRFDIRRNWALVRALLQEPAVEIQYLFCNQRLRQAMLEHAREIGEDDDLIEQAENLLRQPGDSLPHDDHLHVRIYCASSDRPLGCQDQGPVRWWKKRYKYMPPYVHAPGTPADRVLSRLLHSRYFRGPRL